MNKRIFMIIIAVVFLTGCEYRTAETPQPRKWNGNVVHASYQITDTLETNLKAPISQEAPIIIASFVDINDLKKSSPFGRIMAEQIGSRLSQKGYKIIEMKLRQKSIFVDAENKGEFLLSRNLQDISNNHSASAVVVGTYAQGYERVYVTVRIINPKNSIILASCDYEMRFRNYKEMNFLMRNRD